MFADVTMVTQWMQTIKTVQVTYGNIIGAGFKININKKIHASMYRYVLNLKRTKSLT